MEWPILVVEENSRRYKHIADALSPVPRNFEFDANGQPQPPNEPVQYRVEWAMDGKTAYRMAVRNRETNTPFRLAFIASTLSGDWDGLKTLDRLRDDPKMETVLLLDDPLVLEPERLDRLLSHRPFMILVWPLLPLTIELLTGYMVHLQSVSDASEQQPLFDKSQDHRVQGLQALLSRSREENKKLSERITGLQMAHDRKTEFLTVMSHEIRTPLSSILGMVEILENEDMAPTQRDMVNTIYESGDTLLTLVNDLLDMAKIEAGKVTLDMRPFHLETWVTGVIDLLRDRARRSENHLILNLDPSLPVELIGDRDKLRQVLINLLSNALKYTQKGTVTLSVRLLEAYENENILKFTITDTGVGIPEDQLEHLFVPFTQIKNGGQTYTPGTGLGLAVCKRLVEMMHGTIGVESKSGQGSSFHFSAAFTGHQSEPHPQILNLTEESEPHEKPVESRTPHILIVEDNTTNRKIARVHLSHEGYEVLTASNGREAIQLLETETIDLILMDIQMPIMDGFAATKIIRKKLDLHMPIIALTANVFSEHRAHCFKLGMDDFIAKPIRKKIFLKTIEKWIGEPKGSKPGSVRRQEAVTEKASTGVEMPLDYSRVVAEFEGDQEMVRSVVKEFMMNTRNQLTVMSTALFQKNSSILHDQAHALKGGSSNLCAGPLAGAAQRLEHLAGSDSNQQKTSAFFELVRTFGHLEEYIRTHQTLNL